MQIVISHHQFVGIWKFVASTSEANFVKALGAIDSVRSGGTKPFIAVTKSARERIYAVSPILPRSGTISMDLVNGLGDNNLPTYPDSCGEIAAGWFLWALRDAASQRWILRFAREGVSFLRAAGG